MLSGSDSGVMVRGACLTQLGWLIDVALNHLYHINVRGREHFSHSPSTLVVSNHRRDTDGPLLASVLINRSGFSADGVIPYIVAREDLLRKGFLRDYLHRPPPWMRELLSPVDLAGVMRRLQVLPIRRIPERSLGEVLEDVVAIFGDLPLDRVLKTAWVGRFEEIAPPRKRAALSVLRVLSCRYRPLLRLRYGLTKLTPSFFRAIKPYEKAIIVEQLQRIVHLLDDGHTVQLQPEGTVSREGGMLRIRNGLHLLLSQAHAPVRVLPIGITYDFMTTGRQHTFINIGPELTDLQGLARKAVNTRVSTAILAQSTVTASHLAGRFLAAVYHRGSGFTADELIDRVGCEAYRYRAAGAHVDPRLLDDVSLTKRMRHFIGFGLHAGLIVRRRNLFFCPGKVTNPAAADHCEANEAIGYVANEWSSFKKVWSKVAGGFPA